MGGLLAARVLADFYRTVTVVNEMCCPMTRRTDGEYRRAGTPMPC